MYPIAGMALALGAPVGLVVTHAFSTATVPTLGWAAHELARDWTTYLYVTISTSAVMGLLGWMLGRTSDELEAGALTDPLTGLWNRRKLMARLDEEVARATRYGTPLSLLMIDVDGLKQINDQGGHRAGDEAIARVADAIRSSVRRTDIVSRHGGDELAILAPATSAADAGRLGERIRATLAGSAKGPSVTISVGVADLTNVHGFTPTELWETADRALYRSKSSGRNRVTLASESGGPRKVGRPSHTRLRACVTSSTGQPAATTARRARR